MQNKFEANVKGIWTKFQTNLKWIWSELKASKQMEVHL